MADSVADLLFTHSPEARENLLREGVSTHGDPRRRQHDDRHARGDAAPHPRRGRACSPRRDAGRLSARHAASPGARRRSASRRRGRAARRRGARAAGAVPLPPAHARGARGDGDRRAAPWASVSWIRWATSSSWDSSRRRPGVLTDSGGIQEETTYLGIPCFTLRDNTERPVTVELGSNTLLGLAPERIAEVPALIAAASDRRSRDHPRLGRPCCRADRRRAGRERSARAVVRVASLAATRSLPLARHAALARTDPVEQFGQALRGVPPFVRREPLGRHRLRQIAGEQRVERGGDRLLVVRDARKARRRPGGAAVPRWRRRRSRTARAAPARGTRTPCSPRRSHRRRRGPV